MPEREAEKPVLLVAEDDPAAREFIELAARRSQQFAEVRLVEDGQAVLNALWGAICAEKHAQLPDLLVIDLNMPGLNGIEVIEDLKAHAETGWIPAAMLTGAGTRADRERALAAGAAAYYEKPRNLADLTRLMNEIAALRGPRPRRPAPSPLS